MKNYRSDKFYISRLTWWIDRFSPFDLHIDGIPGAEVSLHQKI